MKSQRAIPVLVLLVIAGAIGALFLANRSTSPEDTTVTVKQSELTAAQLDKLAPGESIVIQPDAPAEGENVPEVRYLPQQVSIAESQDPAMVAGLPQTTGTRKLTSIRKISDPSRNGQFLAPKVSPDGLQMLVVRPGYAGVFILGMNGTGPIELTDAHVRSANWTADGKIEVTGDDGLVRTYGADGTLESTAPASAEASPVYADNDVIFTRPGEGAAPVPLTADDDRYFNPQLSPDGSLVVYQGLYSGLYVAPADGSGEPVFLGPGNHATWMPDGSGILFDRTQDDGHYLTEGDIVHVNSTGTEVSNLTEGDSLIGQMPSISPDGSTVVFEADGGIYAGTLR